MGSITDPSVDCDADILIIGGGLSGCYALWALRQLKPSPAIKLLEAGKEFGGVWHWNRYPGARTDSHWPHYQLNIPEVWKDWKFSEVYAGQDEVQHYFRHMDKVLDLQRDAIFNTVVHQVHWNQEGKKWIVDTEDGMVLRTRYLIVCTGSSSRLYIPDIKGLESFRGPRCHSARFFAENFDMTGKRIGIIGNGSTGVQIVQELSKKDCELISFLRTPIVAFPTNLKKKVSNEEEASVRSGYPDLFERMKHTYGGIIFPPRTLAFKDATNEQRDAILQKAWDHGGFAFSQSTFREFLVDKEANRYMYNFWADRVRARVSDPEKRDIVAPIPQQNWFGTKRPGLEQDYYESIDRPNVKLVNLKNTPLTEITENGVMTEDGTLHEVDALVFATGYDALNGSQMALGLHDRNDISLREKWAQGTETYLGLTVPGLPNTFFSYGPQGPTALGNAPPMIEVAVQWIKRVIQTMEDTGIETIEPQPEAAREWRQNIQDLNDKTLMADENSWWTGSNIPGKVREQLNYLGGLDKYAEEIEDALDGWKGFDLGMKQGDGSNGNCNKGRAEMIK